ncbi:MAG: hypothetical protein H6920_03175 [Sphingomonadaceae bacterium]|nr:hypothetical protein [Sphingomonadaceae bacterium]
MGKLEGRFDKRGAPQNANRWLRVELYQPQLIGISSSFEEHCEVRIEKFQAAVRGAGGQNTYFHRALIAIFAHRMDAIRSENRRRNACYLWHAYRHFVDPADLEAFVHRIPLAQIEDKVRRRVIESGFEEGMIEGIRADGDREDICGPYPGCFYLAAEADDLKPQTFDRAFAIDLNEGKDDWDEEWFQ